MCGVTKWSDANTTISYTQQHALPTMTVIMTSTINQAASDESWGFKDFEVFLTSCP
jgi:hypothetical protein